jgi:LysM repeat protein
MRTTHIFQRVLIAGCLLLLVGLQVSAQSNNLLVNPGFEAPFNTLDGNPPRQVAQGWTPWHVPAAPGSPSFANLQPEYEPTAPDTTRIREGSNAQLIRSFFGTHDGGVYQQVTGITSGDRLRFRVFAYVWSTTFDDVNTSEEDGNVFVQVGIDPTGGVDGTSSAIVWSPADVEQYDSYNAYTVEAQAASTAVTVFVRTKIGLPVKNSHVYLDSASLERVDGAASATPTVPTATPTSPTSTSVPPSNTPVPPSNTPVPPTATATHTTLPPTATATVSATPISTTQAAPSATQSPDPLILTATAIVAQATQTAVVAQTASAQPSPTSEDSSLPQTATAIVAAATATAGFNLTATAGAVQPTATSIPASATPVSTPTPTATRPPIGDEFPITITHTVQRGESVFILAARYGSTIEAITQANGLNNNYLIRVGQILLIPVRVAPTATATSTSPVVMVTATPPGPVSGNQYIVRPGDTLTRIARLFNTNVAALAQLNGIVNIDRIQVGQRLIIPGNLTGATATPVPSPVPDRPQRLYIVRPGDSLYRLSLQFGVSIARLAAANNITNINRIYTGQALIIP